MRLRFLPMLISTASLAVALAAGRAASDADNGSARDRDEEAQALRKSLFKKPLVPFLDTPIRAAVRATAPQPIRVERAIAIVPPPAPREISLAERELSLQPAAYTPYDPYSGSVREVIAKLDRRMPSMERTRALMNEAHGFRYRSAHPYLAALPATTSSTHAGDCKAKALWLYDQLGDPSALYVIGKTFKGTKSNHAWVYWRNDSRWWILDPTNRSAPIPADSMPKDRYVPYYSFGKQGAFRHRTTWIFMAGSAPVPAVATPDGKARVARQ